MREMDQNMLTGLNNFENDRLIKNIHLTLVDTKFFASIFDKQRGFEWAENPKILDNLITFLRQIKSVKNLLYMLRQLDNISCSLILILAEDIRLEYVNNLRNKLRELFSSWYDEFVLTICDN